LNASQWGQKMEGSRSSKGGSYNTIYSQQWLEEDEEYGLPRMKSIQIWELDGVLHKEAVIDKRVTDLLRRTVLKMEEVSGVLMEARERIVSNIRNELLGTGGRQVETKTDPSKVSHVLTSNWMSDMAKEGPLFTKKNPPTTDSDCYWDYYNVACAWPRYCVYTYKIGDLHLGQSCRVRETPLAKDDPELLLKDHVSLNETFNVSFYNDSTRGGGAGGVEWRIVYRDRNRRYFPPWFYVFLAFVGGAMAVICLLYVIFFRYRERVLRVMNDSSPGSVPSTPASSTTSNQSPFTPDKEEPQIG